MGTRERIIVRGKRGRAGERNGETATEKNSSQHQVRKVNNKTGRKRKREKVINNEQ